MAKTAAEVLVERLQDWGVDTIFGFAGDALADIFEVMRKNPHGIRFIQVRHEEAAAFAAGAYAKLTGKLGVCMATSGPGGVHLANGLYDANASDQPVLAITGQTWSKFIGTRYQQEVALDRLYIDVAGYSERVASADNLPRVIDEAIKCAFSRRTVAHINIPRDILTQQVSEESQASTPLARLMRDLFPIVPALPRQEALQEAAAAINAGSRVAIMAGQGCLGARDEVLQLADAVAGPIIKPLLGKAVVPDDSPFTTGGIGLLGTSASVDALRECDTLIIAGSGFPYMDFYPKPERAKTIQIDIDPTRIGLRHPADVGLIGDCAAILRALLPLIQRKSNRGFLEKAQERMGHWNRLMEERGTNQDHPMKPQVVFHELNKVLANDAIVTCDAGTDTTWIARHVRFHDQMQFLLTGTFLATMACSLPYAVGAAIAQPGRQVVCVAGDGAFTMLMGEMATLVQYNLPVKVIIVKNNALNQVRWEQIVQFGYPEYAVELQPIDFAAYAKACGAAGYTLDDPAKAESVLREAFAHPGPALIEAVVDPNEPPMPGRITTEQALGLVNSLRRGQPHRWTVMKEALAETIHELRSAPGALL
ncbi:MAG: thiamine pyrophosphate-dependent enzyme [Dehalococcoidia bacterium]